LVVDIANTNNAKKKHEKKHEKKKPTNGRHR
jgi:hypothetical protein